MHYKRCCCTQKATILLSKRCCYPQKATKTLSYSSHKSQVVMFTVSGSIFSCGLLPSNSSSLLAFLPSTLSSFNSFFALPNSRHFLFVHYCPARLSCSSDNLWSCCWLVGLNEGRVRQWPQLLICKHLWRIFFV